MIFRRPRGAVVVSGWPRAASSSTSPRSVKSPLLILRASRPPGSPESAFGLRPPILPDATLPLSRKRRTYPIVVLALTPNSLAADCGTPLSPQPLPAASENRQSVSFPSVLTSIPVSMANQKIPRLGNPKSIRPNFIPLYASRGLVAAATKPPRHRSKRHGRTNPRGKPSGASSCLIASACQYERDASKREKFAARSVFW